MAGRQRFEIPCASRGFHVYREVWTPRLGQSLKVEQEINNVHDPFAISLGTKIPGKLTDKEIVGHIPREISRFCHYFLNYGGKLETRVTCARYRPSPIPTGGLEIPILLIVLKADSTDEVFEEMENLVNSYYIDPDQIVAEEGKDDEEGEGDEIDLDIELVPESEIEETQEEISAPTSVDVVPETQTQTVPETQDIRNTQIFPETQNVIVIDD